MANLMVKIFTVVSLAIVDEATFLGLVAAILDILTIVTEPIIPLILVGLSMVCLKALTYTLKSNLLLRSPLLMLVWLISSPLLPIFVPRRITKLKLSLVSLESSMKLFSPCSVVSQWFFFHSYYYSSMYYQTHRFCFSLFFLDFR